MKQEGSLSARDVVTIVVGIVVGVGIFKTPSLVAAHAGGPGLLLLVWLLGGVISLNGSLCYAELATTYPHHGGDYHYITQRSRGIEVVGRDPREVMKTRPGPYGRRFLKVAGWLSPEIANQERLGVTGVFNTCPVEIFFLEEKSKYALK